MGATDARSAHASTTLSEGGERVKGETEVVFGWGNG